MAEAKKNVSVILDRIKVLNLEDCMFELKTILDYLDSIFVAFEKERLSRKVYEEASKDFEKKLNKTVKLVTDIYEQLDDIENMYDLNKEDVKIIDEVNKDLIVIKDDHHKMLEKVKNKATPYSSVNDEVEKLSNRLKQVESTLDIALKSLGNMYEDEQRAREQLDEIQELLKQSKIKIRAFKLPIVTNDYFVQLSEANDAILEIIKELERKPIVIKTLNTRVDTARDLVLKLYNTTNETTKLARMSEMSIVYGNRFRSSYDNIDQGLNQAEILFYKGNYRRSLEVSIRVIEAVEPNFGKKLDNFYKKEI